MLSRIAQRAILALVQGHDLSGVCPLAFAWRKWPGIPPWTGSVRGMEATTIARQLALGRIVLGGVLTVTPGVVTRTWVGEATTGAKVLGAGFGARDVAIGAGLWRALDAGEDARPWLLAGAASDAADLLATLAAGRSLPRSAEP